ncbi:MAG: hypothetical protein U0835_12690 [Isosphaeraceae bacterium]
MNEVRHRSRLARAAGAREVQGVFAISGLERENESAPTMARSLRTARAEPPTAGRTSRPTTKTTDPRPLPYRSVLAVWPDEWRERWGRRANVLEEAGLSWRDAEGRAFLEVWNLWKCSRDLARRN